MSNPREQDQSGGTVTFRQVKVNLTLWRRAVREHGGCSPEAYRAYQRFLVVQESRREQDNG